MPKRRNKYEIYAELLDTVARKNSCRLTRASYGANLPVDRAKATLTFLASRGFIKESSVGESTIYTITKRGLEYLQTFRNMRKLFAALDESHGVPETETAEETQRVSKIGASITLVEDKIQVDDEVKLQIKVANLGETSVTLESVEKIVPNGFELVYKPDNLSLNGDSLIAKGIDLDPNMTEELRLNLRPHYEGTYSIGPRIVCSDESGDALFFDPPPKTVKIIEADIPRRLATGYKELDNLLLGGIPEKYAVILTSPPCDERDLLISRFLTAGRKEKQTTLYVATDANILKTLKGVDQNFYIFICNPQGDAIAETHPNVLKLKSIENLTDMNIAFTSAFRKMPKSETQRRAFIGILSDILLEHGAVRTRRWLTGLLSELKSKGFTTVVLLNPKMHSVEEVQAVLDPFEGEIDVHAQQTDEGMEKFLRIRRMFNQRYLENEMPLRKDKLRM